MVSQKEIQSLDFKTWEQYMDYVLLSKENGNHKQAEELIKKMSKKQKLEFIQYLEDTAFSGEDSHWCKNKTLQLI